MNKIVVRMSLEIARSFTRVNSTTPLFLENVQNDIKLRPY